MSARANTKHRSQERAVAPTSAASAAQHDSLHHESLAELASELGRETSLGRHDIARVVDVVGKTLATVEQDLETRRQQLIEERHLIERVVDALPVGLYVVDREYRVQAWNHTREIGLQGIARGEALGRTIFEILHRQPAELLRREFDDVFASGELRQFETESQSVSSERQPPRTYRISKIPLRVSGEHVTHVITVGEDVTSWKAAEARVAQAEKLAAIGQLAAGVMHEINNPLATIAACAESMVLQLDTSTGSEPASTESVAARAAQHLEYLRVIEAEVHRCKGIVSGLLDFSRARSAERATVDINAILEQTMFLLKHHKSFKQRSVHLDLDRGGATIVQGNGEQLIQVLMVLLHNAADAVDGMPQYTPDARTPGTATPRPGGRAVSTSPTRIGDGTITVRTRGNGVGVVAEVVDGGAGIPRALQTKIFEPFFTTKPPGQGTGLGLSVCYGIVTDHGGRMEVESAVGVGSTFRIVLPRAEPTGSEGVHGARSVEEGV